MNGQDFVKKAKGVKASVGKKTIETKDYIECLFNHVLAFRKQYLFKSRHHQISTISQTKLALSYSDDKRFVIQNQTDTLPYGHYAIDSILDSMDDGIDDVMKE